MVRSRLLILGALLFVSSVLLGEEKGTKADNSASRIVASVDALFSRWNVLHSPGCSVSVERSQKILLSKSYGESILEAGTANSATTVFHVASVSKQFTAFAIHLLQAEGKLSLDDDIRKYVPELHTSSSSITLRQLLHHMSGVRDQWALLELSGRRMEDTITQKDVLRVIFGQQELNFAPGSRFSYSNSNYSLLALVVERVSGQAFPEFMRHRIFEPLGMSHTYVQDSFRQLSFSHSFPYAPARQGYERRFLPYSSYGATDVQTTAEDLALWAMNLDQPKVGSPALIANMLATVNDNTGRPVKYASGLEVGEYRGTMLVEHSGSDPGYVADFLFLPAHHFGVAVLCNTEGLNPVELAHKIADLYVGDQLGNEDRPQRRPVVLGEAQLRRFEGLYKEEPGILFAITMRDGKLFMQGRDEMVPFGEHDFFLRTAPVTFSFSKDASTLIVHEPDHDRSATRVERVAAQELTPARMTEYVGDYYSPELRMILTLRQHGKELWVEGPGYEARVLQQPELLREPDAFYTESMVGSLQFRRDGDGRISDLLISNGRVISLRFRKITNGLPAL